MVAFLLSAALCGTAAVALVVASRDEATPVAAPSPTPSETPTESPTPEPTTSPIPVFTVTPAPTVAASPTPAATARATASPAARPTTSPRSKPTSTTAVDGLALDAILDPANGTSPGQAVGLFAHATDADGTIHLVSVTWGDGSKSTTGTVKDCAATGKGDCKDISLQHTYAKAGTYSVTITVASSGSIPETNSLTIKEFVNGPSPEPSPTA